MKKSILNILFAFLLLLTSCASAQTSSTSYSGTQMSTTEPTQTSAPITVLKNSNYTITELSGDYYLTINDSKDLSGEEMQYATVMFNSLKDMKDKILNNKLSENELKIVNAFSKTESGIKIVNPNKLYSPVHSQNFSIAGVSWEGEIYRFALEGDNTEATFSFLTKEAYEEKYDEYENFADNKSITIQKTEKISERNATVIHYTTSTSKLKNIFYEIELDGLKLSVKEGYILENSVLPVSETIPFRISIYGEYTNGLYFHVYCSNLTERPSLEWITSFGLTEYVE